MADRYFDQQIRKLNERVNQLQQELQSTHESLTETRAFQRELNERLRKLEDYLQFMENDIQKRLTYLEDGQKVEKSQREVEQMKNDDQAKRALKWAAATLAVVALSTLAATLIHFFVG